ncbi:MAG: hypothetical protein AAGI28_00260 [Pseudomonadota bacterium]
MGRALTRIDIFVVASALAALALTALNIAGQLIAALILVLGALYVRRGRWQMVPLLIVVAIMGVASWVWKEDGFAVWALVASLLAIGIGVLPLWLSPVPRLPSPSGKYAVGLRIMDLRETCQAQVYLWYPADSGQKGPFRPYHTMNEANAIAKGMKTLGAPGFFNRHLQLVRTHTLIDPPMASGRFPMIVFNHGGGLYPMQSTALMEELASHGFLIASIGHAGGSLGLAFEDGSHSAITPSGYEAIRGDEAFQEACADIILAADRSARDAARERLSILPETGLSRTVKTWAQTSQKVLDILLAEDGAKHSVLDHADPAKIAAVGMSLGGATALRLCLEDPRIKAGIVLDGIYWCFDDQGRCLDTPLLQFYSDPSKGAKQASKMAQRDFIEPDLDKTGFVNDWIVENASAPVLQFLGIGLDHMDFTDRIFGKTSLEGSQPLSPAKAGAAINRLCRVFLRATLDGIAINEVDEVTEPPLQKIS